MPALAPRKSLVAIAAAAGCAAAFLAGAPVGTASATPLKVAKPTPAEINARELAAARRAHLLAVRYEQDVARASLVEAKRAEVETNVRSLHASYLRTRSLLQHEAVLSYVGAVPSSLPNSRAPGAGEFVSQADRQAYEQVALGDISGTLGHFRRQESELIAATASYKQELTRDLAAERLVAAGRHQALQQAAELQVMLTRARAELAAQAAKQRASAGPPVGAGVVAAVAIEMGLAYATPIKAAQYGLAGSPRNSSPVANPPPASGVTAAQVKAPSRALTTTVPTTTMTVPTTTTTVPTTTTTGSGTNGETAAAAPAVTASGGNLSPTGGVWLELRECESGDNYQANTGNGYYGAYQFTWSTWTQLGFPGRPDLEPYWMQDEAAQRLQAKVGWSPWPACATALGL